MFSNYSHLLKKKLTFVEMSGFGGKLVNNIITHERENNVMKLILILKLLLLFSFFATSQGQIQFDTLEYNLEPVSIGQTAFLKIPFSNIGDEPLVITRCQSTNATSIISSSKKPILPNQSDTLHVKMINNSVGNFKHTFVVGVNNQDDVNVVKVNVKVVESIEKDRKVSGKVFDKNSGEPLYFATVSIDKTSIITATDFEGAYSINASLNDTLIFSFVGMKMQKVRADQEEIIIQLEAVDLNEVLYGPAYYPTPKRIEIVTIKDIENANNPKYNFKKNAKNNVFVIFVSELTSYDFNKEDIEFQQKYNVKYSLIGSYNIDYVSKHNKLTFKHLKKRYQKTWQTEIRKDAVGLDEFF
jgi:hypothetical protein